MFLHTFVLHNKQMYMNSLEISSKRISLEYLGIIGGLQHYQLTPEELQEISLSKGLGARTKNGTLAINTGTFTGRSPKDRFIVKDKITKDTVWWGDINLPYEEKAFDKLYTKMVSYLSQKVLYVRDAYACADDKYQINIRFVTDYPWSNQFVYNMFIEPKEEELEYFDAEWTVINAPEFMAQPEIDGTRQHNFSIINFTKKIILIGGTGYTGEIKKSIFSVLNFTLPTKNRVMPMHCSANVGAKGDTAIFFGLSGTGKTTLSADPNRKLIGDDEHGWTPENTVFNFEGGCYAKVLNLSADKEPEIFGAIKEGALLENVILKKDASVDYDNASITQNTRVSYPIEFIKNIQKPSIGKNPKNIFFLTADAFGVLPPIAKLTPAQAAYHFISGYTAKVAGTEEGVTQPIPSFSACFGAPFMPLHPTVYAEMLRYKIKENGVHVWLVNTGWTGGEYGQGHRMKLAYTRAMINAALDGSLGDFDTNNYTTDPFFNLAVPNTCQHVPDVVLQQKQSWQNDAAYDAKAKELATAFKANFAKFESYATDELLSGGPL